MASGAVSLDLATQCNPLIGCQQSPRLPHPPLSTTHTQPPQAVLAGLKALKALGVWGVSLDIDWASAEPAPRAYSWAAARPALALARDAGLKVQLNFCFHAGGGRALPRWVEEVGERLPDIYYTDKGGARCKECLSLGVDEGALRCGGALRCLRSLQQSAPV